MPLNIGDYAYDMRNINNLDVLQRVAKKGVITAINSALIYIKLNDNSVIEVPIEYVAPVSFIEPV